jgi:glycosyltransferase involved in cell wall biosynthesis
MNVEQLRYYLYDADVLLIPPTAAPLHKHGKTVLPMKVFQYLASGRPILAPRLADSAEILNPLYAVLVEPDNWEEAAQAVRRIFSEPNWSESLANQAKIDSQHYTWERRAQKIISFLNERLNDDGHQL